MFVSQRRTEPEPAIASEMFRRVLAPWAMDIMRLRRMGLDRPTARRARRLLAIPGEDGFPRDELAPELMDHASARRLLRVRPAPAKLRRAA